MSKEAYNYRVFRDLMFDSSNWFPTFWKMACLVDNWEEYGILHHLLNIGASSKVRKIDGWFQCTVDQLQEKFGNLADRNVQTRVLKSLEGKGLISLKKKGIPASRHIRIEMDVIESRIVEKHAEFSVNWKPSQLANSEPSSLISSKDSLRSSNKKTRSPAKRGSRDIPTTNKKGFGLTEPKEDPITKWSRGCATRLHRVIVNDLNIRRPWNTSTWAKSFLLLLSENKLEIAQVDKVLDWYLTNAKNLPSFRIQNAKHFRNAFYSLESMMGKALPGPKVDLTTLVKLNERDQEEVDKYILPDLKMLNWPGHSAKNLRPAVAQSLINLRGFAKSVRKLKERMDKQKKTKSRDMDYCYYLGIVYSEVQHTSLYLTHHFRRLHEFLSRMTEWRGDFSRYIFSLSNESVRNDLAKMATKHGGGIRDFDRLMEEFNALNSDA